MININSFNLIVRKLDFLPQTQTSEPLNRTFCILNSHRFEFCSFSELPLNTQMLKTVLLTLRVTFNSGHLRNEILILALLK